MPVSRKSGNTGYETLNTHEIVTGKRNPKLDANKVRMKYE